MNSIGWKPDSINNKTTLRSQFDSQTYKKCSKRSLNSKLLEILLIGPRNVESQSNTRHSSYATTDVVHGPTLIALPPAIVGATHDSSSFRGLPPRDFRSPDATVAGANAILRSSSLQLRLYRTTFLIFYRRRGPSLS